MDFLSGFGIATVILMVWGGLTVGAALIIWAALIASSGLNTNRRQHIPPTAGLPSQTSSRQYVSQDLPMSGNRKLTRKPN